MEFTVNSSIFKSSFYTLIISSIVVIFCMFIAGVALPDSEIIKVDSTNDGDIFILLSGSLFDLVGMYSIIVLIEVIAAYFRWRFKSS